MQDPQLPRVVFDLLQSKVKSTARVGKETVLYFDVRDRLGEFHPAKVLSHADKTYREFLVKYRFFRPSDNEMVTLDRILPLSTVTWRRKKGASDKAANLRSHEVWIKIMALLRREDPMLYSKCLSEYEANVAEHPYFGALEMPAPGLAIRNRKSSRRSREYEARMAGAFRKHGWHDGFNFSSGSDALKEFMRSEEQDAQESEAHDSDMGLVKEESAEEESTASQRPRRKRRKKERSAVNGEDCEAAYEPFPPRLCRASPLHSSELNEEAHSAVEQQENRARALEWLRYRRELAQAGLEEWRRRRSRLEPNPSEDRPKAPALNGKDPRPRHLDRRRKPGTRLLLGTADGDAAQREAGRSVEPAEEDPGIKGPNDAWQALFSILQTSSDERDLAGSEVNGQGQLALAEGADRKGGEAVGGQRRTRFGGIAPSGRPPVNGKTPLGDGTSVPLQKPSNRSPNRAKGSLSAEHPRAPSEGGKNAAVRAEGQSVRSSSPATISRKALSNGLKNQGKKDPRGKNRTHPDPTGALPEKLSGKKATNHRNILQLPATSSSKTLGKVHGSNKAIRGARLEALRGMYDEFRRHFVRPKAGRYLGVIQRKRTLDCGGRLGWLARWETKVDGNLRFIKLGNFSSEAEAARAVDKEALRRKPISSDEAMPEIAVINFTLEEYFDDNVIQAAGTAAVPSTPPADLGRKRKIFGRHLRLKNSKERCPECGESTGLSTSGVVLICDGEDCGQETHLECTEHSVAPAGDFFCSLCQRETRKQQALARVLYRCPTPRPKVSDFPVSPIVRPEQKMAAKPASTAIPKSLPHKPLSALPTPGLLSALSSKLPASNAVAFCGEDLQAKSATNDKKASATSQAKAQTSAPPQPVTFEQKGGLVVMRRTATGRSVRICSVCKSPAKFLHQAFSAALGGRGPDRAIILCESCAADAHEKKPAGHDARQVKKAVAIQGGA